MNGCPFFRPESPTPGLVQRQGLRAATKTVVLLHLQHCLLYRWEYPLLQILFLYPLLYKMHVYL